MSEDEPKRLGLVKTVRAKSDAENPYLRLEFTFHDDRSGPVSLDLRSSVAIKLAEQIVAAREAGNLDG